MENGRDKENSELRVNTDWLAWAGFIPPDGEPVNRRRLGWFAITLIQFVTMNVLVLVHFVTTEFSLGMATSLMSQSISASQTLFRRIYFTIKINKIAELVDIVNEPPQGACAEFAEQEREMRVRSTKRLRQFTNLVMSFNATVTVVTIMRSIFLSAVGGLRCAPQSPAGELMQVATTPNPDCAPRAALLFDLWWPTPLNPGTPTFFFIIAWQVATLITQVTNVASTDAFACSLALAAAERSNLLCVTATRALMPGRHGCVTRECRTWLWYHQRYLKIIQELNSVMGLIFFSSYIIAGVNIITLSYFSVKVSDSQVLAVSLAVLGVVLVQLFTYAHAGQAVLDKSEELARSTLGATQVAKGALKEGPARSVLLVLVTRLSGGIKPEMISGLGYFSISMELFTKVLSASVSYLLVLLQLRP